MDTVKELEIAKVEGDVVRKVSDKVITELALAVYVDGSHFTNLYCSPFELQALVYGHLFSEGVIQSKAEVKELSLNAKKAQVVLAEKVKEVCKPKVSKISLTRQELFKAIQILETRSPLSSATGGVHSCALYELGGTPIIMEDIGRHNTIDKVLGKALLLNWDFSRAILITSGRVFASTVQKALQAGVQIVISAAAPTYGAVQLAREGNLTLCGFASAKRVNIYSVPERISFKQIEEIGRK